MFMLDKDYVNAEDIIIRVEQLLTDCDAMRISSTKERGNCSDNIRLRVNMF